VTGDDGTDLWGELVADGGEKLFQNLVVDSLRDAVWASDATVAMY